MPIKKISIKEWEKLGLPTNTTTLHIGPYFKWDRKNKKFEKPKIVVTRNVKKVIKNDWNKIGSVIYTASLLLISSYFF